MVPLNTVHFFLNDNLVVQFSIDIPEGAPIRGEFLTTLELDMPEAQAIRELLQQTVDSSLKILDRKRIQNELLNMKIN